MTATSSTGYLRDWQFRNDIREIMMKLRMSDASDRREVATRALISAIWEQVADGGSDARRS